MKKVMVGMKVFQLTPSGMVEIIEFETQRLDTEERQNEAIERITEMLYKNDSVFITFDGQSMVVHDVKHNTFRVKAVWEIEHGKNDDS